MYTEENEFDYDEYLDENFRSESRKPFFNFSLLLKILLILLCVFLVIFFVFKFKNRHVENKEEPKSSIVVFNDNLKTVREIGYRYFFQNGNLPKSNGEIVRVNLKKLKDEKLLNDILDENDRVCGYNASNITMKKNPQDYEMMIYLACSSHTDTKTYYYDLSGNCLTCNGEVYVSPKETNEEETNNIKEEPEKNVENQNEVNQPNDQKTNVCSAYSNWSEEPKSNEYLDVETKTVVRGYQEKVSYGEWSEETKTPIVANNNLEVRSYEKTETTTSVTDWSSETTKKPKSIEGREITSRNVTTTTQKKVCEGGGTYQVERSLWDSTAIRCYSTQIGKVVCTYRKPCTNRTKTISTTTTYYKYRDTIINENKVTYYQSRPIQREVVYTDYILEKDMPTGYQKVEGSEKVLYRYRERCSK